MMATCEGSGQAPLPSVVPDNPDALPYSEWENGNGIVRQLFMEGNGVCAQCHQVKAVLRSGGVARHTRRISYKEQQQRAKGRST
jgi:mono/diheme cytochrome c family protein